MLLNLSNHPTSKWAPEQRRAAEVRYGGIKDMAFPRVPPEAGEAELDRMAGQFFKKIKKMTPAAVHVMGEMTFTHRLVCLLKGAGVPCIASTTDRIVEEREGKKVVQFRFVRFRAY